MAGYAKIWTDIFNDAWFLSLSLTERGVWLQLITYAKLVGDTGVVRGRSWAAMGSLWGCDGKTARKILVNFLDSGKVAGKFLDNYIEIEIVNYKYWQGLTKNQINPESRPIKEKSKKIPSKPDQSRADQTIIVGPKNSGPISTSKKVDNEKEETITRIIEYLNQKAEKRFDPETEGHRKYIRARLEKFSEADCKKVIDIKCAEWIDDPKFKNYLRPKTLFTPEHFEAYLNQDMPKEDVKNAALALLKDQWDLIGHTDEGMWLRVRDALLFKINNKRDLPDTGLQMQEFIRRVIEYQSR